MLKTILKPKQFLILSVIIFFSAVLTNIAVEILSVPPRIQMLAGDSTNNSITANFPFAATISGINEREDYALVSSSSDEPVLENIVTFSLNGNEPESRNVSAFAGEKVDLEMSLSLLGIPVKTVPVSVLPDTEVIPCGKTVGVRINTAGVMVLGTGAIETEDIKTAHPSDGKLRSGDLIIEVTSNGKGEKIEDKRQLQKIIEDSDGEEMTFEVKRDNSSANVKITPVKSAATGKYTVGAWIRDGTQGIGTITYFNPSTKMFGALGHGILDVDTKKLMTVKKGQLMDASVLSIKKGRKGSPGELEGDIKGEEIIGIIKANTALGLYGSMEELPSGLTSDKFKIALKSEVHEGPATIRSNINGSIVSNYDVYIESVNRFGSDDSKGMVIRITDANLLNKTNGIVQGMSGSPIIQDGRIIGAVTHVFIHTPAKGYGVFIENMIRQEANLF